MLYEDDKILTIDEYEKLAKEYLKAFSDNEFKLIRATDDKNLVQNALTDFALVCRSLFCLGGFLNTSRLYSLTCKQIKSMQEIYQTIPPKVTVPYRDKTRLFLYYLGCENSLILNLINLAKTSQNCDKIEHIIYDRLVLSKNIFLK